MTVTIEKMVERWSDPTARPLFKGRLIDDDGCCCAQGDVLRLCGWSDDRLRSASQEKADREVAKALNVSVTHAVLLRQINDQADGCPQDVLAHPERVLGDQAPRVLAFWRAIDEFTPEQWAAAWAAAGGAAWDAAGGAAWDAARAAAGAAAWDAAWAAARAAAGDAAGAAAWDAARAAAGGAAWDAAGAAAWDAAWDAARAAAGDAAGAAAWATNEIQGAERLTKFYFLPIFGINHPDALTP